MSNVTKVNRDMDKSLWSLCLLVSLFHTALCDCRQVGSTPRSCSIGGQVCIVQTSTLTALNTGRVHICRNGEWGTVAGSSLDPWSEKNAQVACRQAGFSGAINSIYPNLIRSEDRASSSVPVHYSQVSCRGEESSILNCNFQTTQSVNHFFDVFVVCRPNSTYSDIHPPGPNVGDLRLYGDRENGQGAVEIFTREFGWSSLCPDGFDSNDAAVICQQFGYETGSAATYSGSAFNQSSPQILYGTDCVSNSETVTDLSAVTAGRCRFSVLSPLATCPSGPLRFAGVHCSSSSVRRDGDIRLFGGVSSVSGIVEVFYNGKWGAVCEQRVFALTEVRTVCEQLGLNEDDAFLSSARGLLDEESAMKAVWLRGVDCSSSDDSFTRECEISTPIGYGECASSDLAAVTCEAASGGGLPSGAITGIIFAIIFFIFFLLPLGYYFGKDAWRNRRSHGWYNRLTTPSEWCDCCPSQPSARRTFNLSSNRAEVTIEHEVTLQNLEPTEHHSFGGFTGQRSCSSSGSSASSVSRRAEEDETRPDPGFTKMAPPTYNASENFPSVSAPPEDLPPPYPGPAAAGPALGFVFSPSAPSQSPGAPPPSQVPVQGTVEASAPPLNPPYPLQDTVEASAPPTTDLGPAYPPPTFGQGQTSAEASAPPPSPGYPVDTLPGPAYPPSPTGLIPVPEQELPYPVNIESGGGAYPPPTVQQ